ncbi:hypothetical protein CEXT_793111 [Caerostris extrusa]|uniref:Uncharacterized protein n=1 Tax=Caerostris extrusa TaxID=172846 RepID=A0AAV4V4Z9_CAEEX|nr:hypothetical protein CEXT_793111 [Caerostris extrusa]
MIIASVWGKFAPAMACGEKDFEGYLHCHGNKVDSNTFKARIITRYKRMKIRARLRDDESFNNSCKMRATSIPLCSGKKTSSKKKKRERSSRDRTRDCRDAFLDRLKSEAHLEGPFSSQTREADG